MKYAWWCMISSWSFEQWVFQPQCLQVQCNLLLTLWITSPGLVGLNWFFFIFFSCAVLFDYWTVFHQHFYCSYYSSSWSICGKLMLLLVDLFMVELLQTLLSAIIITTVVALQLIGDVCINFWLWYICLYAVDYTLYRLSALLNNSLICIKSSSFNIFAILSNGFC